MMNYYANGISYEIIEESDGWFSIYEIYMGRLFPLIQSSDIKHAKEYCYMREPVPVPMNELIPNERFCKSNPLRGRIMIKKIERNEVLQRVRFANKFYSPFQSLIYKSTAPKYFGDLEIIRYNRQDWIEVQRIGDDVYFKTLEDFMNSIQLCLMIIIDVEDLQHLTDCGYGFLNGRDKDE